jgi:hypothetical protein
VVVEFKDNAAALCMLRLSKGRNYVRAKLGPEASDEEIYILVIRKPALVNGLLMLLLTLN